jgi:hypothetical protein
MSALVKKWLIRTLALVCSLVFLWLLVGTLVAGHEDDRVRRAWAETALPMEEFERQHATKIPPNAAATGAMARAAAFGCNLRDCFGPPERWNESKRGALDSLPDLLLSQYVSDPIFKNGPTVQPPPELADFLSRYATPLNAFEDAVLDGPELVWAREPPSILAVCPSPMVGRKLVNVLLSQAINETRKGNPVGADRALETAWAVNAAYREVPLVIDLLIATAIDGEIFAAVRRLGPPPEAWRSRIATHDYRRSFSLSLQGEVLFATAGVARENDENANAGLRCRLWGTFQAPYTGLSLASYSDLMRRATLGLREWKDPCSFNVDTFVESLHIPSWNVLARVSLPGLLPSYMRAIGAALDQEVTGRILEARESTEHAPPVKGGFPSDVCPGLSWNVEKRPDQALTLAPSRPLPWTPPNLTLTATP